VSWFGSDLRVQFDKRTLGLARRHLLALQVLFNLHRVHVGAAHHSLASIEELLGQQLVVWLEGLLDLLDLLKVLFAQVTVQRGIGPFGQALPERFEELRLEEQFPDVEDLEEVPPLVSKLLRGVLLDLCLQAVPGHGQQARQSVLEVCDVVALDFLDDLLDEIEHGCVVSLSQFAFVLLYDRLRHFFRVLVVQAREFAELLPLIEAEPILLQKLDSVFR